MKTNQEITQESAKAAISKVCHALDSNTTQWEYVDEIDLVNAWIEVISGMDVCKVDTQQDTKCFLKSAWSDFLRCDKDRDDAFRDSNNHSINCPMAAHKRYLDACDAWRRERERFIGLVNIETGRDPIWDANGCTLRTGERYEY